MLLSMSQLSLAQTLLLGISISRSTLSTTVNECYETAANLDYIIEKYMFHLDYRFNSRRHNSVNLN